MPLWLQILVAILAITPWVIAMILVATDPTDRRLAEAAEAYRAELARYRPRKEG